MKTLYAKFVAMTIVIMVFSSIAAFFVSNIYYHQALKPKNDEKITRLATEMVDYIEANQTLPLDAYLQHHATLGYHLLLIDENGQRTSFNVPFRDQTLDERDVQTVLDGQIFHGILHFPHQTFVTGFFANEAKNAIGVPLEYNGERYALFVRPNIKLLFNEMHFLFAALLGMMILLSVLLVLLCTKFIVKPITHLTKATTTIANGQYDVTYVSERKDELGKLSQSFAQMATKLAQNDEHRKVFIASMSHDIQSPLSNIKGYVALLQDASLSTDERRYLETIDEEIARLSGLTEQLLQLTTLDQQAYLLNRKSFSLTKQLETLVKQYEWKVQQKNLMMSYQLADVDIIGDDTLLYTVWDNILSNAIKYTPAYGMIDIELLETETTVIVRIADTGIGMSEADQQKIFERFYRADQARTRTVSGNGLGLSIVRTIVALHEADIDVTSAVGEGTTVTITIKKGET